MVWEIPASVRKGGHCVLFSLNLPPRTPTYFFHRFALFSARLSYIASPFLLGLSVSFSGRSVVGRRKTYYSCILCLEIIFGWYFCSSCCVRGLLLEPVGITYSRIYPQEVHLKLKTLIMAQGTSKLNWLSSLKIGTEIDVSEDQKYLRKVGAVFTYLLCSAVLTTLARLP
jgi:hypothetical protein